MLRDQEAVEVPVGRSATSEAQLSSRTQENLGRNQASVPFLTPPIDIYEAGDGLVLEADLPGVSDGNLTIELEDNVLVLRGRVAVPNQSGRVILEEYRPGDFYRSFILSDEVDRSKIAASLKNGVLQIILPRADRVQTRRIEIKVS